MIKDENLENNLNDCFENGMRIATANEAGVSVLNEFNVLRSYAKSFPNESAAIEETLGRYAASLKQDTTEIKKMLRKYTKALKKTNDEMDFVLREYAASFERKAS